MSAPENERPTRPPPPDEPAPTLAQVLSETRSTKALLGKIYDLLIVMKPEQDRVSAIVERHERTLDDYDQRFSDLERDVSSLMPDDEFDVPTNGSGHG